LIIYIYIYISKILKYIYIYQGYLPFTSDLLGTHRVRALQGWHTYHQHTCASYARTHRAHAHAHTHRIRVNTPTHTFTNVGLLVLPFIWPNWHWGLLTPPPSFLFFLSASFWILLIIISLSQTHKLSNSQTHALTRSLARSLSVGGVVSMAVQLLLRGGCRLLHCKFSRLPALVKGSVP
jgi:hypothetical protein